MKKIVLCVLVLISTLGVNAQTAREVAVEIRVSRTSTNYLRLSWLQQNNSTRYQVFTKTSDGKGWDRLADLKGTDTAFTDSSYTMGTRKEYRVARTSSNYTGFDGNGYIVAGFDVPATAQLGRALVVIEDQYRQTAQNLVADYLKQLENEGYTLDTHYVNKNDSVTAVKDWLFKKWSADKNTFTTILLLGRVPVPYSGNYRPDGHPEHTGAWPADLYYGAFDIGWTDNTINNTQAQYNRNHNVPGDGKFDLSRYNATSQVNIQYVNVPVGRVDLSNMPSFGADTFLIKRYMNKALDFRTGRRKARLKSLVDDNFGYFGSEAFASGGFRNGSVFSAWDISTSDYRSEMSAHSYLLSYGCGAGSYTSCAGVSSSAAFVSDSLLNPFTLIFGSYFGDWDNQDNFLRAPLASKGWGLSSVWSGRPYWMMHSCAQGAPLAQAVLHTQNTWNVYNAAGFMAGVHVALMGDPTLRMFVVDNVHDLDFRVDCKGKADLIWGRVSDLADSVVVQMWNNGSWDTPIMWSSTDTAGLLNLKQGNNTVSVRFLKRLKSASGTWWQYGARRIETIAVDTTLPSGPILGQVSSAYCADSAYVFRNDGDFNNASTSYWTWNNNRIAVQKGDTLKLDSISNNKVLYLTRTSPTGCVYTDSVVFNIPDLSSAKIYGLQSHYCLNTPYVLRDSSGSNTNLVRTWNWKGQNIKRDQSDTFSVVSARAETLLISVMRTSEAGCKFQDSWELTFSQPNKPRIVVVDNPGRIGDTIRVKAESVHAQFEWNQQPSQSDSNFAFVAKSATELLHVRVKDSVGCWSDTSQIAMEFVTNSAAFLLQAAIEVYPNPVQDELWISTPEEGRVWKVKIVDTKGAEVWAGSIKSGKTKIEMGTLATGVYTLSLQEDKQSPARYFKIIK